MNICYQYLWLSDLRHLVLIVARAAHVVLQHPLLV